MTSSLHRLTPTPPMGWNSFDAFGLDINEKRAFENLAVFIDRLKPAGYEYFVLDAGWYRQFDLSDREFPAHGQPSTLLFDEFGRHDPAPCFFPNGLGALIDACHAAGVKFGLHMMRGIPRAAVEANTRVLGSDACARDIANTSDTCSWNANNYGVDMARPGAQAYYDSVIAKLADWGVDFIKYDDIVPSPPEVEAVVKAIERSDRDIVLSLSPGNGHEEDGWPSYFQANMIRTSGDIWDNPQDFRWVFQRWEQFMPLLDTLPRGCWLDMDMIPFGELQLQKPRTGDQTDNELLSGKGAHRMCGLNTLQKQTFMTMRALGASPLFMGGHLPGTDEESFALLTNADVLACNQNGVTGRLVSHTDWTNTWVTPDREIDGAGWLGVFNRDGKDAREVTLSIETLKLPGETKLRDIWRSRSLPAVADGVTLTLEPDEVLFAHYSLEDKA